MKKIGPNEACYCGSGLKYKKCHRSLDGAAPEDFPRVAREIYARRWSTNSDHFSADGHYDWMARLLAEYQPKRVLDIGCGNGAGILALYRIAMGEQGTLISLEENPECLRVAVERSRKHHPSVRHVLRSERRQSHGEEIVSYRPLRSDEMRGFLLIESDILSDPNLLSTLVAVEPFDAVTIWLIGSHDARSRCANLRQYGIRDVGEYRLHVQNTVYELADRILRHGGVLQVVDRGITPDSEELQSDVLQGHREQAEPTTLEVINLNYRPYEEPRHGERTAMMFTPGTSGYIPEVPRFSMVSVISVKR